MPSETDCGMPTLHDLEPCAVEHDVKGLVGNTFGEY